MTISSCANNNHLSSEPCRKGTDGTSTSTTKKSKLYTFQEARRIARGHGFDSKEEFLDYSCPGAYQLPKDPDVVWKDEWISWDDFLGIVYTDFSFARTIAREELRLPTQEAYMKLWEEKKIKDDDAAIRLPYRPDLHFKNEWISWDDWLGTTQEGAAN